MEAIFVQSFSSSWVLTSDLDWGQWSCNSSDVVLDSLVTFWTSRCCTLGWCVFWWAILILYLFGLTALTSSWLNKLCSNQVVGFSSQTELGFPKKLLITEGVFIFKCDKYNKIEEIMKGEKTFSWHCTWFLDRQRVVCGAVSRPILKQANLLVTLVPTAAVLLGVIFGQVQAVVALSNCQLFPTFLSYFQIVSCGPVSFLIFLVIPNILIVHRDGFLSMFHNIGLYGTHISITIMPIMKHYYYEHKCTSNWVYVHLLMLFSNFLK